VKLSESLVAELTHEASSTRKMFERLPEQSLTWKPHSKSRSLGEIAEHIAGLPGVFIGSLDQDEFDRLTLQPQLPGRVSDLVKTFDRGVTKAFDVLQQLSDEQMMASWRYRYGERIIFEMPRLAVIRAMGINHLIHHRGQLSVYLRLLDVPVPSVYGPTADEA